MSLTQRKPRPLSRDTDSLRDDRLFIVACDDTYAPKQYFGFFRFPRVQIYVIPTPKDTHQCHAIDVLQRLKEIEREDDDELWMLLDADHYIEGSHLREFTRILKEAREKGVSVALSKPCFELWLLLHHLDKSAVHELTNAKETETALRKVIGEYNKTNLKQEHYPLDALKKAYLSAKALDQLTGGSDIPESNTSRVYLLWQAIFAKALPSQIPPELIGLLPSVA